MDDPARWLLGVRSCFGLCKGRTLSRVAHVGHTCLHGAHVGGAARRGGVGAVPAGRHGDV